MDACCDPQTFCRQNGIVSSPKGDGSDRRCLPSEQMAQAHRRLLLLTGVLSVMVLVPLIAGLIMHELTGAEPSSRLLLDRGRHGGLLLLSLGLVAWLRLGKPGPDQVVALAGTYQVLGALIMSLSFFAVDPVLQATPSQLTWLGVWILFFPLVAPTTPWTTAGLAAASALTAPLVFAGGDARPR